MSRPGQRFLKAEKCASVDNNGAVAFHSFPSVPVCRDLEFLWEQVQSNGDTVSTFTPGGNHSCLHPTGNQRDPLRPLSLGSLGILYEELLQLRFDRRGLSATRPVTCIAAIPLFLEQCYCGALTSYSRSTPLIKPFMCTCSEVEVWISSRLRVTRRQLWSLLILGL